MKICHFYVRIMLKLRLLYKLPTIVLFICSACVILLLISVLELRWIQDEHLKYHHDDTTVAPKTEKVTKASNSLYLHVPKYVVFDRLDSTDMRHLKHVFEMLDYFNCQRTSLNASDWDVLWSFYYPFRILSTYVKDMKPHQLVNHFPGTGYITNKVDLALSGIAHIPPAFKLPNQKTALLDYVKKHPQKLFVQKSNSHRGIRIQKVEDLNLNTPETFVQEFIHNPLLVDGFKFDVGIYTIITSIDPLRLYIYNGDFLLRFCPEKYHPFDPQNLNKYVIGDDYLPTWKVPSLMKYYNELGFGMRESLNAHLRSQGKNPQKIWDQMEEAIRLVVLKKEPQILKAVSKYPSKNNFFEMFRFDFVVDDELNVFLLEANMSPNLSSDHYPPNQLLYRQVLFGLFSIVGLAHFKRRSLTPDAEVALKNIMVDSKSCSSHMCETCMSPECQLCMNCLTASNIRTLKQTYREFNNKQDNKRIFPPTMTPEEAAAPIDLEDYSSENQFMYRWFRKKCLMDVHWC
ncbi:unnamed protein product [Bemisia tabaci]|uniref:Tubulin polyglutamylase TTLL6 n=1 Tax=Bemisia tabaci TaxID=7038 RepID=A0A9P0F029_BEMTA|nr:unnamed protein product [Bemisia tabaci]